MNILILGAAGGFGAAMVEEALGGGHSVVAVARDAGRLAKKIGADENLTTRTDDIMKPTTVSALAQSADAVIFAVNVAYEKWEPFMEMALKATLEGLSTLAKKPLLVFPGNVYALGPQTGDAFDETAPNRPSTRKGRVRDRLERMLEAASKAGQPVLIPRLADFFGPTVRNGMTDRIFGNAAKGKAIEMIGTCAARHQFTFVPDAARATMSLIEKGQTEDFKIVNMPTHSFASMEAMAKAVALASGNPTLKVKKTPWSMIRLLGLVAPTLRELAELRYLFEDGVHLGDTGLRALLPGFTPTNVTDAFSQTLSGYRKDMI
jgi:nucleoside-diphosphate-sugar epimerase